MIPQALDALPGLTVSVFLVFCRIGGCLMLVAGLRQRAGAGASPPLRFPLAPASQSSQRSENSRGCGRVRAISRSLQSSPALRRQKACSSDSWCASFSRRCSLWGKAVASALGIGSNETSVEDGEQIPALTVLITLTATALFFITDQHLELLRALTQSYNVFGFGAEFGTNGEMAELAKVLTAASFLALQVCRPCWFFQSLSMYCSAF